MRVTYLDHMGSDRSVLNAARASYAKHSDDLELTDSDKRLLEFLAVGYTHDEWEELLGQEMTHELLWSVRNKAQHFAPFCHPTISLRIEAPIAIARQLWKSHVGVVGGDAGYGAWSEQSGRYVDMTGSVYEPPVWRAKAITNKQGSSGTVDDQRAAELTYLRGVGSAMAAYSTLMEQGVAPEQARFVLPAAIETSWVWTGSLMFFSRVCGLRSDAHAQAESGFIAEGIEEIVSGLFPYSWKALKYGKCFDNE
jgi:thymidylate synthase (FAD)